MRVWLSASSCSLMELKATASCLISPLPFSSTRAPRSPLDMRRITLVISLMGRVKTPEKNMPEVTAASATATKRMVICVCTAERPCIRPPTEDTSIITPIT